MTFPEFFTQLQGYVDRMEDVQFLHAAMTAHLLQPHLKKGKRITPHRLLGKKEPTRLSLDGFTDPEQYRKAVERMRDGSHSRGD